MARPLRLELPGALYHVTARGDRREPIYFDDDDRQHWLGLLGTVCGNWGQVLHYDSVGAVRVVAYDGPSDPSCSAADV